jgi:alpha-glucosidase/alpha-D-xyloside xylohydrolase
MRAMWLHYPGDKVATAKGDQYLWGKDMIIAPVYEKGASMRKVYLPEGIWYDWWNNTEYKGGEDIEREVDLAIMPLFVRAGAIIPFDPLRQYTSEPVDMPIELKVFRGDDGSFTMYEDDGISLDYLENKNITLTDFIWNDNADSLTIRPRVIKCVESKKPHKFKVILLPSKETKIVTYNSKSIKVKF